jgi:hypothetical protein
LKGFKRGLAIFIGFELKGVFATRTTKRGSGSAQDLIGNLVIGLAFGALN